MEYILVLWPLSQEYMQFKDFDQHASLDMRHGIPAQSYFIEKKWMDKCDLFIQDDPGRLTYAFEGEWE